MREESAKVYAELNSMKNFIQELSDRLDDFCKNKANEKVVLVDSGEASVPRISSIYYFRNYLLFYTSIILILKIYTHNIGRTKMMFTLIHLLLKVGTLTLQNFKISTSEICGHIY